MSMTASFAESASPAARLSSVKKDQIPERGARNGKARTKSIGQSRARSIAASGDARRMVVLHRAQVTNMDRRRSPRVSAEHTCWQRLAIVRPGREVFLLNLSRGGALIESSARLTVGARTELQLFGPRRRLLAGRVERCRVVALDPLRYEGALIFDEDFEMS
jgi:hypothetical protein